VSNPIWGASEDPAVATRIFLRNFEVVGNSTRAAGEVEEFAPRFIGYVRLSTSPRMAGSALRPFLQTV